MKNSSTATASQTATATSVRGAASPSQADWSRTPERSNLFALRAMCWVAITCGRRATRWLLPPLSLYFLLFSPVQRRNIRRYLSRAIGPQAGWIDGYRLLHAFASTVLDRIFFLRGRMDLFDVHVDGNLPVEAEALAGRGAFLLGAHIGSFEALGACRSQSPDRTELRAAMLMFPDNAQQINAVLGAISLPELRPHVIALGVQRRPVPAGCDAAPTRVLHGRPLWRRCPLRCIVRAAGRLHREPDRSCRAGTAHPCGRRRLCRTAGSAVPRLSLQLVQFS